MDMLGRPNRRGELRGVEPTGPERDEALRVSSFPPDRVPARCMLCHLANRVTTFGVAFLALLAGALGASSREVGSRPWARDTACHPLPLETMEDQWLPRNPAPVRQAVYGATDNQVIGSFGGLGYRDGAVYLFDQSKPEVVVLSPDSLLPVHRFGRRGEGPGEFWGIARPFPLGRYVDFRFLSAGSSGVAVYDGTGIELFDLAGVFERRYLEGVPSSRVFGFRYVGLSEPDGRVLFAVDKPGDGGAPERHLETWAFDIGNEPTATSRPRRLWELPLTHPPTTQRGVVVPRLQARPLWAVWGRCVVATDGAGDDLRVFNIDTGVVVSHRLPDWPLPEAGENDSGGRFQALPGSGAAPTARIRWEDLVVDPGAAWVRQWSSDADGPARVAIVDLRDGGVRDVKVPAFPRTFGDAGVYFAVEQGTLTESYIVRYSVSR